MEFSHLPCFPVHVNRLEAGDGGHNRLGLLRLHASGFEFAGDLQSVNGEGHGAGSIPPKPSHLRSTKGVSPLASDAPAAVSEPPIPAFDRPGTV